MLFAGSAHFSCTPAPESKREKEKILTFSRLDFGSQAALVHLFCYFRVKSMSFSLSEAAQLCVFILRRPLFRSPACFPLLAPSGPFPSSVPLTFVSILVDVLVMLPNASGVVFRISMLWCDVACLPPHLWVGRCPSTGAARTPEGYRRCGRMHRRCRSFCAG